MAHVTLAASEKAFVKLFEVVRDEFEFAKSDSADFGAFSAGYDVKVHLEGGTVDLRADNTVSIKELDLKWDKLDFFVGIDIPEICIGGFCIIPTPFGCALRAPRFCVFSADPDITIPLNLSGLITSEISVVASLLFKYFIDPNRQAWMDDWDAEEQDPSVANRWQLFLDPQTIDLDVFDIADIIGDLLENALDAAIDGLLGWLPGWAKDIIKAIIGGAIDILRAILDIGDDIEEWLSDILNVSFGLIDIILTFVADYFAAKFPLFELDDPYPILEAAPNPNGATLPQLVPVKIPIKNVTVYNDDLEMVVQANVG
ncbi:MAG: hypothetical protein HGB11_11930 [Chlorobiales bacterium]|nr:hypothetical protein [Chlorobiales bacterium]